MKRLCSGSCHRGYRRWGLGIDVVAGCEYCHGQLRLPLLARHGIVDGIVAPAQSRAFFHTLFRPIPITFRYNPITYHLQTGTVIAFPRNTDRDPPES